MQFILSVQWVMKYLEKSMLRVFAGQTDEFDEDYHTAPTEAGHPWPHKHNERTKMKTCPNSTVTWWLTAVKIKYLRSTFSSGKQV